MYLFTYANIEFLIIRLLLKMNKKYIFLYDLTSLIIIVKS